MSNDARPARLTHELATKSAGIRILTATAFSQYGDWLTTVALLTVLYQTTNSALGPAAYMLFRVGPRILGSVPGGYLADRYSPEFVACVLQILQGAFTLVTLLAVIDHVNFLVYLSVALAQIAGSASRPLFPALIGIHTPSSHRTAFNAADSIITDTSLLIAPLVGAALLAITSAGVVIGIDCLTFLAAAAVLRSVPESHRGGIAKDLGTRGATAGFRFLWRHQPMRLVAAGLGTGGAVLTLTQAVLVVAAAQRFGGPSKIGYCYAALGIGGILGGAIAIRLRSHEIKLGDLFAGALLEILPLGLLPLSHSLTSALPLLFVSGVAGAIGPTFSLTYMQNHSPPEILGRVSGAVLTINFLGMVLGAAVALLLAQLLAWPTLLSSFTVLCAAALIGAALISGDRTVSQSRAHTKPTQAGTDT